MENIWKNTKRLLSILLCICMVLSIMPVTVRNATAAGATMKVYFKNNWLWSDVGIYYWGSSSGSNPGWPGIAMQKIGNDGSHDIYVAEIPADVTGIIFNNKNTSDIVQSVDITSGWYDGICYSMLWKNNKNNVKSTDISTILQFKTIYFQNNWNWSDVKIYYWWDTGSAYAYGWPGTAMTKVDNDGSYDIYSYQVPANVSVIISGIKDDGSGSRDQTPDILKSSLSDCAMFSMEWNNGNQVKTGTYHAEEIIPGYAASCTDTGLTDGKKCTVCGVTTVKQETIPVAGHTGKVVPGYAAGCENTGLTDGEACSVCGATITEQKEIPASGHNYNAVVTEPDCVNGGYTTYTCDLCNDTYTTNYTEATGHTATVVNGYAPDCENTGLTDGEECSVCGATITEQKEIPASGHKYNAVVTEPDCVNGGYTTYTCSVCGDSYVSDEVDANGHDYDAVVTEPDCINGGYTTYTCTVCNDTYTADYTEANGHTGKVVPGYAADCENTGLTNGEVCSVCGITITEQVEIPANGHKYNAVVTEPDCVNGGYTTYTCSVCGDSYVSDEVDANGHDYDAVVTEPDCINGGYTTYTCTVCNDTYTADYTEATGHTATVVNGYDPDCENTGLTDGVDCAVCGAIITEQKEIPANGHDYDAVVTEPDCTNDGYTTYTCSVCGDSYVSDEVDANGHDYETVVTDPDCFNNGYTTYTCSICGDSYVSDYVDPIEHEYEAVVTEPDCVNGGYTTYTCSLCGDINVADYTEANGHTGKVVPGYAADCENTGLTNGEVCTVCGTTITEQVEIPANGHNYDAIVTEPDCINGGYTTYTCSACGDSYVSDETDATGHTDADGNIRCDGCNILMKSAHLWMVSISLKGNIAINYYMLLSDEVLADETAYMQFTMVDGEIIKIPVSDGVQQIRDGETYYVFSCAVNAKEMTDNVVSQFFYEGGATSEFTYNIKSYADYILTHSDNEDEKALATAMLNYGAASQLHFEYNTENLANAGMGTPNYSDVIIEGFDAVANQGTELAKFYSASLILKSETTLRFFFKVDASVENFTVSYKGQDLAVSKRGGLYYADVVGISARDLDEDVTITVNDGTNTANVTFNPMAYCQGISNDTTGSFDEYTRDLVAALYLYNQAANNYFKEG